MDHQEFVRIVHGAKTAVLFIHGIVGTPNHFRDLLPLIQLVPDEWSVYNVLLPGHGGSVDAFGKSSMRAWKEHVWRIFDQLADNHEKIILVGHSMGTLFSIQMALERPEKVACLFLIAVPFRMGLKGFGVVNLLRLTFGRLNLDDPVQAATKRVCGIEPTWKIWEYIPRLPRVWELLQEMYATAKQIDGLCVPCVAFQSQRDELVSDRSRRILENSGRVEVHNLLRSTHFYYSPDDIAVIRDRFSNVIEGAVSK